MLEFSLAVSVVVELVELLGGPSVPVEFEEAVELPSSGGGPWLSSPSKGESPLSSRSSGGGPWLSSPSWGGSVSESPSVGGVL